jgi:hypothetical protein
MSAPTRLSLVQKAIRSGWRGHIEWKDAAARLVRDDPELLGLTPEGIKDLLRQFVLNGNSLKEREETRQEYLQEDPDNPFWYRALIPVPGLPHGLFVEVKLIDDDPEEPWVQIVSAHRQRP